MTLFLLPMLLAFVVVPLVAVALVVSAATRPQLQRAARRRPGRH